MKKPLKKTSNSFLSSPTISNEEKVEILNEKLKFIINSSRYLNQDPDINDYYLQSNLEEINMNRKQLLEIVLWCLVKPQKIQLDYKLIFYYLFFMKEFTKLLKKQAKSNTNDLIYLVATHLEYINIPQDKIMCKYGDRGNKAYIVLNGNIDILIPQKKSVYLDIENYYLYIATLIKYKEFTLLINVLKDNSENYPIDIIDDSEEDNELKSISLPTVNSRTDEYKKKNLKNFINSYEIRSKKEITEVKLSYLTLLFEKNISNFSEILINYTTSDNYIERLKVYEPLSEKKMNEELIKNPNKKIFNFVVYDYVKIITKKTGSLIGEIALIDSSHQRSATMISYSDCDLGVLKKKGYDASIKIYAEKNKRQNINFILDFFIFKTLTYFTIFKKYYNNFVSVYFEKGFKIYDINDKINDIIFIKEGDFDISIRMSFNEIIDLIKYYLKKITDFNQTQNIKKFLNFEHLQNLAELRAYFGPEKNKKFLEEKRKIKLFSISSHEIIGLEYFINVKTNKSIYEIRCSSIKGEGLSLSYDFYNLIKGNYKTVRDKENEFVQEKYLKYVNRLLTIRKSLINTFYAHESKEKGSKIEDEISSEIEREKIYRNLFNGKRNLLFFKTNYNFKKNFHIKLKKENKKNQLNNSNKTIGSESKFIWKNLNEKNEKFKRRKYNTECLNSFESDYFNDKLYNEVSRVHKTLFESFYYPKEEINEFDNKNKVPNKFIFNDMIWEKIDSKENKSSNNSLKHFNKSFPKNYYNDNSNNENNTINESNKNNSLKKSNKISLYRINKKPFNSYNLKKFNFNSIKGRCYYDDLRKLQIKILKK